MNSKILLILKYLWENTDEENTVSIADIIRNLSEYGFSSDRKTIVNAKVKMQENAEGGCEKKSVNLIPSMIEYK